jgi:RNA polymerase sigma-70 factor (ECF subfamily)
MNANDELIPTRQSLLSRLKDWDDSASWQDFFDTYWKLIYKTARNAELSPVEAEEVVQETLISICKNIRKFQYDEQGSFKGWLRTMTVWRIRDRFRAQKRNRSLSIDATEDWTKWLDDNKLNEDPIAKQWDLDWEQNLAEAAIDRVKRRVAPKHFQIFDLAVSKQWPTARIARTLKVSSGYVYLVKHRVCACLRSELRRLRREPCELNHLVASP